MKKLSLFSLMLMAASMFLFLGGCRKDEVIKSHEMIVSPGTVSSEPIQEYLSLSKIVKLERYFKRNKEVFSARNALKLDTSRVLMVKFDDSYLTYSIKILNEKEGAIQNVIFLERNGVLSEPNILEFQGTRNFVESFNKRLIGFDKFEGKFTQYTIEQFASSGKRTEIDCPCYEEFIKPIILGESGTGPSGGSDQGTGGYGLGGFGGFGNLGHGTNAGQDAFFGTITSTSNNPPPPPLNSFNCPPGFLTIYIFGVKYCIPMSGGGGGGDKGGGQNGELETFGNGNLGSRISVNCLDLIKGIGVSTDESGDITPYTATNDPISNQMRSCFDNPEILKKINELKSLEIFDPCTNERIEINVGDLALDVCFGCKVGGAALTPESLEDAYFEALEGVDHIIIDPNTCKNVSCITSKLMNHMQGKTNSPFFGFLCNDSNLSYTISSGSINQGTGVASIKGITLETSLFCGQNADPVELAETILHESIHTAFYAMDYFTKNKIPTDPNVLYFYNILKAPQPNGFGGNHHEFMAWHVTETAQILKDMNGGVGQVSDYYGLIWNGLSQGAGVDPVTQNLYNLYIDATMNLPGNNPNNLNQKDWISGQLDIYNIRIKPNNVLKFDCK